MSECVILYRNTRNRRIGFVADKDPDELAVFKDRDEAEAAVDNVPILRAYPYQIVELDEIP